MKSGKILVVDDEPAEREGLARLVGQWGYEVETAASGEEALNLVETQHPAVVLTDLVLPEMDGLTLLQRLKETVIDNRNVFEVLMDAVRVCSLGQITDALFEVGGQYRRSM